MIVDDAMEAIVNRLVLETAMLVDRDELEAWIDCFAEDGRYAVLPRENRDQGFKLGIMYCPSKAAIRDRIAVLRHASKFNPHYDRHILSRSRLLAVDGPMVQAETNFMIVQSSRTGVSQLFCAGCYEDRIRVEAGRALIVERIALIDTFSVPTLVATPV